jgi:hypothetical protein
MKKIVFVLTLAMGSAITMANVNANNEIGTEVSTGESFKLINDTKQKISIHTGTGFVSLEKGSSTSVGCNVGKEVRYADSGKKGDVIFEIDESMCGKTIKLSEYIN